MASAAVLLTLRAQLPAQLVPLRPHRSERSAARFPDDARLQS
jgi:hypothetical protein